MSDKIELRMGAQAWLMLITLSILWGGTFFLAEIALSQLSPLTLVFSRVSLAALGLIAVIYLSGSRMPSDMDIWRAFFLMGLLNNCIPFSLIFWGQLTIASGLAAIFNATTPLFTVILAHFLTRNEKMTLPRILGVAAGFVGVSIMIGTEFLASFGDQIIAQVAILGAALSYGFASIYGKKFAGQPPMVTAAGQLSASTILLLPFILYLQQTQELMSLNATVIIAVIAIALLSTSLAYILYFKILKVAGATNLALVTFLIPVSAIALGILVLDEQIQINQIIGMTFITLGLIAIDGRIPTWIKNRLSNN